MNGEPSESAKRQTGCFMMSLIGYSIASVVITVLTFIKMNSSSYDFADIATNWQTGAIMDIIVAPSCSPNYEEAFNYTWPGNEKGCYCANISLAKQIAFDIYWNMQSGSCLWNLGTDDIGAGCTDIHSNPSEVLANYSQINSTDMKVCVLRSQETWLQVAQQSGPNCTANNSALKQCGFSPENIFCTTEPECPINNVTVLNLTLPAQSSQLANCTTQNNCTVLAQSSSSAKILFWARGDTFDALPTAQMRLNEYSMCDEMSENDITPGRKDFGLMNHARSTCYTEGASLWNWTDSITEAQLFSLNGMTGTIDYLESFGYYAAGEDGSDYIYSLFSRSYIPWDISCRGDMNSIISYSSQVHTVRNLQLALMIVTILGAICLGIVLPCLVYYIMNNPFSSKAKIWARRINHGAKIPMLALMIAVLVVSVNTRGFFLSIMNEDCSTQDVMGTLSSVADGLEDNFVYNVVNIALLVCLVFIGCAYFHRRTSVYHADFTYNYYNNNGNEFRLTFM